MLETKKCDVTLFGDPQVIDTFFPGIHAQRFIYGTNNPFAYIALRKNPLLKEFSFFIAPHYVGVHKLPIPLVLVIHDFIHLTHPASIVHPVIASRLMKCAIGSASHLIAVSKATRKEAEKLFPDSPPISVLTPPLKMVDPQESSNKSHVLCVVSNDKPHKGIDDLLNVWESLIDPPELVIAGVGSERLKGKFPGVRGRVSQGELDALYRDASLVVIPSQAEGFGYVMAEAHAHGVPVVARPVPALLEQKTKFDFFARDFSLTSFREVILFALQSDLPAEAPRELREVVKDLSPEKFAESLTSLLSEIRSV
jgi:glycosyltransferase involved in cell wall biosynthesis